MVYGSEFHLLPPQPPQVFSVRGFEAFFPLCWHPGLHGMWDCWLGQPPPHLLLQLPPCPESSPPEQPVSSPPTDLDECFFFNSLVVGLPYSSIFCQFWLFLFFSLLFPSFGCTRKHGVSTYASILAGSPTFVLRMHLFPSFVHWKDLKTTGDKPSNNDLPSLRHL